MNASNHRMNRRHSTGKADEQTAKGFRDTIQTYVDNKYANPGSIPIPRVVDMAVELMSGWRKRSWRFAAL